MNEGKRPRRRWFRFSLRTLLIFTVLVGLLMGWIAKERMQSLREANFARSLEVQGWTVQMGGPFDKDDALDRGWFRGLARQILGERIIKLQAVRLSIRDIPSLAGLTTLRRLEITFTPVSDLSPLTGLENLKELCLQSTQVSDLTAIAELKNLGWLRLDDTKVTDLSPLSGLKRLYGVTLNSTPVTDLQPLVGLERLDQLYIRKTNISELKHLIGLQKLHILDVTGTPFTEKEVEALRKALPKCIVQRE